MRRATGLFDRIPAPGNLLSAFLAARKGKASRPEVQRFSENHDADLAELREQLLDGTCRFDQYRFFSIHDPKERRISVAPFMHRVLHHAVMDVCEPVFERAQVFDSYACRAGKGTRAALNRAAEFAGRYPFYMKLDVRKYFDSISHARLKGLLARLFKEPPLLELFGAVIDGYAPFADSARRGLPIGNVTSQFFANHYLAGLDHYAREVLCVPGYVRYMDDMVVWGRTTGELLARERAMREYCANRLEIELKPPCINRSNAGLPFLGFVVLPGKLRLSSRSCRRARRRLRECERELARGGIDEAAAGIIARSVLARADWSTGAPLRRKLLYSGRGHCPRARSALCVAAAGSTTPGTVAPRTATGTSRTTAGTTTVSALFSPAAQGNGRMSTVEPGSAPVRPGVEVWWNERPSDGRVLVERVDARCDDSRPSFPPDEDHA